MDMPWPKTSQNTMADRYVFAPKDGYSTILLCRNSDRCCRLWVDFMAKRIGDSQRRLMDPDKVVSINAKCPVENSWKKSKAPPGCFFSCQSTAPKAEIELNDSKYFVPGQARSYQPQHVRRTRILTGFYVECPQSATGEWKSTVVELDKVWEDDPNPKRKVGVCHRTGTDPLVAIQEEDQESAAQTVAIATNSAVQVDDQSARTADAPGKTPKKLKRNRSNSLNEVAGSSRYHGEATQRHVCADFGQQPIQVPEAVTATLLTQASMESILLNDERGRQGTAVDLARLQQIETDFQDLLFPRSDNQQP